MIYRFSQPIKLSDGTILGNANKHDGPLGGECFFDKDEDNEIQRLVKEQCAKDEKANEELKTKLAKANKEVEK